MTGLAVEMELKPLELARQNGTSIVLEHQGGADSAGYAGLEDKVDYHWGNLVKAAAPAATEAAGPVGKRDSSLPLKARRRSSAIFPLLVSFFLIPVISHSRQRGARSPVR